MIKNQKHNLHSTQEPAFFNSQGLFFCNTNNYFLNFLGISKYESAWFQYKNIFIFSFYLSIKSRLYEHKIK